ncbi:MAG: YbbR-like domain-containing protein [Bacteroidia bacterium]
MERLKSLLSAMAKVGSANLKALSICLAISFLLWFFQSMGREYTSDIVLPIEYANLPSNKTFSTAPVSSIQLKVTGYGWDLWAYKIKFNKPSYTIDLSKLGTQSTISLNGVRNLIVESVPGLTNILSVQPENINLDLDEAISKKVPVVSSLNILPASGYGFSMTRPDPDSVEIFGPKEVISSITEIYTESKEVDNAKGNIDIETLLEIPKGVSRASAKKVNVKALIESITDKDLEIRIKVKGYKGNKKVNIFPRMATLKLQTTLSLFDKIDVSDFEVFVDLSKVDPDNSDDIPLQVINNSKLINSYRVHPKYVNYILEE